MKQISEGDTTTSSRPAFMGLTAVSLMAPPTLLTRGMTAVDLYHRPARSARHRPLARRTYTVPHVSTRSTGGGLLQPASDQRSPDRRRAAPWGQRPRAAGARRSLRFRPGPLRRPGSGRGAGASRALK